MIDRIYNKCRTIMHRLSHPLLYFNHKIYLYGVPRIINSNKLKLGNNIRINDRVCIHAANGIIINNNVTLSYGATLLSESYDLSSRENYLERKHAGKPIIIGSNVWICANATVLPGVKIADGVIVGAGSVVTKDLLETNSLYAGNPAVFIKRLF